MAHAKIYIVSRVNYNYSDFNYDRCYVLDGLTSLVAFTFPELAEEYCRELSIKYVRENDLDIESYIPYEGGYDIIETYGKILDELNIKVKVPHPREIKKEVWKDLSDQEVLKIIKMMEGFLSFYCVQEIDLIA